MSQVSHDSIWIRQYGVVHGKPDTHEEKAGNLQLEEVLENIAEEERRNIAEVKRTDEKQKGKRTHDYNGKEYRNHNADDRFTELIDHKSNQVLEKDNSADAVVDINKDQKIFNNDDNENDIRDKKRIKSHRNSLKILANLKNGNKLEKKKNVKSKLEKKSAQRHKKIRFTKREAKKRSFNKNNKENTKDVKEDFEKWAKKKWQKQDVLPLFTKNFAFNSLERRNEFNKRSKWRMNSGVLISLVMLNVAGLGSAGDTSGFASALTSRMIASFLGYPTTCNLGTEVRPCTLTLTCWLRGGTRLRGCGGWLFSCCGSPEPSREEFDNSIHSSDWKYKMSPPKLRQVPQRSVMPNNVFRRRVDDDVSQMECGLPSSRILQKRIIGGREARFAEFPWQAHVRISEFQCGGVLVSRWYVATAAHCVSRAHTRDIAVWLGAIDTSATHYPARKIGVIQKILHPLFQFRMTQPDRYDIALLKLSRPITFMTHILPICLPDYDLELRGRSGVIAGWGKTDASNGHTGTNLLRSATVPILSKEQCINWHQSKQIAVEIHSEMICAGHSDGHQDACLGDSGGPLIVLDNGRYYLVGITSAGFGCGVDHQPGIYHNVKITANWIRGVISPSVNYIDS